MKSSIHEWDLHMEDQRQPRRTRRDVSPTPLLGIQRTFLLRFHPRPFSNHPHRITHRSGYDAWAFRNAKVVKFDHFVTTVREKWSMSLLTRSRTGSVNRWHFVAGEEVAVDAPKMDCLGGFLRRGLRDLGVVLHCQSSRERRSSSCCM